MNINDLSGGSPERIHGGSSKINGTHAKSENPSTVDGTNTTHAQHAQDPEVVGLVHRLTESPEIRLERVAEIQEKLQSSEFFNRQSAEATAEAFLR